MNPNHAPFIGIMNCLSPGQSIEVPSWADMSFLLNLDGPASFDGEQHLRVGDSLRHIASLLNSIAMSVDGIGMAWSAIEEDEEDEDEYVRAVERYEDIYSRSTATIRALVKRLQDDIVNDFDL